jgi:hypothetical protein
VRLRKCVGRGSSSDDSEMAVAVAVTMAMAVVVAMIAGQGRAKVAAVAVRAAVRVAAMVVAFLVRGGRVWACRRRDAGWGERMADCRVAGRRRKPAECAGKVDGRARRGDPHRGDP